MERPEEEERRVQPPEVVVSSSDRPLEVAVTHLDRVEERVETLRGRALHVGDVQGHGQAGQEACKDN